jgi:hypothetical protein
MDSNRLKTAGIVLQSLQLQHKLAYKIAAVDIQASA